MNASLTAAFVVLCLSLTSCTSVLTATHEGPIGEDRGTRTLGRKIDDSLIETKASVNIAKAHPELDSASHIVVASYNGVVLIAGQTPRQELKLLAEQATKTIQGVKRVHNELQLLPSTSALVRSNDAWLTTRIKTAMLTDSMIPGSRIKVITENGIIYLMGLVTRQEANRATEAAQGVSGVQRIVRLFEFID